MLKLRKGKSGDEKTDAPEAESWSHRCLSPLNRKLMETIDVEQP